MSMLFLVLALAAVVAQVVQMWKSGELAFLMESPTASEVEGY